MKVPGTVTINLDDYLELVEHTHKTNDRKSSKYRGHRFISWIV